MPHFSLEDKIQQAGSPALMLRTAPVGTYDLPMASEYELTTVRATMHTEPLV